MRRATLVLGFASSAAAVVLFALVDRISHHSEPGPGEANPAPQTSSMNAEPNTSTVVLPVQSTERNQNESNKTESVTEALSNTVLPDHNTSPDTRPSFPDVPVPDADTARKEVREQATLQVEATYSLLVEHLGLTAPEKDALLSLLIEMRAETATVGFRDKIILRGRTIDEDERWNRIAGVIGDAKLQEFLAQEGNLPSYGELGRIASLLQQNGASLTDTQRDGLFKILVEARDRYWTNLPRGVELNSIMAFEHIVARRAEFERHVIELAPSVLAPDQVVYLDEQYQHLSYERANDLERATNDPNYPLMFPVWN